MIELSTDARTVVAVVLFALTYVGMAGGRVPWLSLDRTGIALIAAIAAVALGVLPVDAVAPAIDFTTLAILFALMVLSAQFGLAGFYGWCAAHIARAEGSAPRLLALTIIVAGVLSAVLVNDIVVFAMTPVLCAALKQRGLDPRPFLAGLVGAANAGSAATIIGNPQNILIGAVGELHFVNFFAVCAPPAIVALALTYFTVRLVWHRALAAPPVYPDEGIEPPDRAQTVKAAIATAAVILLLLLTPAPRAIGLLAIAALLLISRRHATRQVTGMVDWHLLLLFASLFVVNAAFETTGLPAAALDLLALHGLLPDRLSVLAPLSLIMSNTIGNVPAVVMLLSLWHTPPTGALYGLAVLSTLAGNLFLVGSIANLIVAERAQASGVLFGFWDHARAGVPLTLASMALACLWLHAIGVMAL
jgi:Na+/H+ antiporter NhaD/arsenite permease-like protein